MRVVVHGDAHRVGVLDGDRVVDVNRAYADRVRHRGDAAEHVPSGLRDFIAAGEAALDRARAAVEHAARTGAGVVPDPVLHAPWPGKRIACAGGNYAEHLRGMLDPEATLDEVTRRAREQGQWGFWKVPDRVPGDGGEVAVPARTACLDYEAEVAIVLRGNARDVRPDDVAAHVWGITLANDLSLRDEPRGTPRPMSYNLAKNFDGSIVLGPCILVGADPGGVDVETHVNGELRQRFSTGDMVFSFAEIVAYLSRDLTLVDGDVVCGGTGAGTAADTRDPQRFLRRGDTVSVRAETVGTLHTRIV
ncbi:fumarylacetoacetate hydrolase family protein [Dactylosporangium sp. NPDC049525]|uniref:fumarylacetoacetate hydrolase family protein n=1 Tax=Dactylosporangium sp. NPDC049525 TaxID=3154730 RepID=UPI003412E42C